MCVVKKCVEFKVNLLCYVAIQSATVQPLIKLNEFQPGYNIAVVEKVRYQCILT